jgi:hypothetical protein
MSYRYSTTPPRNNPAHYMYAPFEGAALLDSYVRARESWLAGLPDGGDAPLPVPGTLPSLSGGVDRAADLLRSCVAATAEDSGAVEKWAEFFLRKIETARRIRMSYDSSGRMSRDEDAGADAYAYAALLFLTVMQQCTAMPVRLRWLNGALKTIDILIAEGNVPVSGFGAACARRAVTLELATIRGAAKALQVNCR